MELASLRLICDQGKVLGVMPPQQARDEAAARGLLLLEVQAKAEPPIWKLVTTLPGRAAPVDETAPSGGGPESQERSSAGKAGKQSTKRPANKEARVKELRLVDKSADHDVATKMNFARGQLEKGRIVQVRVGMGVGHARWAWACTCTCTCTAHAPQVYVMGTGRLEPGTTTLRATTIMALLTLTLTQP